MNASASPVQSQPRLDGCAIESSLRYMSARLDRLRAVEQRLAGIVGAVAPDVGAVRRSSRRRRPRARWRSRSSASRAAWPGGPSRTGCRPACSRGSTSTSRRTAPTSSRPRASGRSRGPAACGRGWPRRCPCGTSRPSSGRRRAARRCVSRSTNLPGRVELGRDEVARGPGPSGRLGVGVERVEVGQRRRGRARGPGTDRRRGSGRSPDPTRGRARPSAPAPSARAARS